MCLQGELRRIYLSIEEEDESNLLKNWSVFKDLVKLLNEDDSTQPADDNKNYSVEDVMKLLNEDKSTQSADYNKNYSVEDIIKLINT